MEDKRMECHPSCTLEVRWLTGRTAQKEEADILRRTKKKVKRYRPSGQELNGGGNGNLDEDSAMDILESEASTPVGIGAHIA